MLTIKSNIQPEMNALADKLALLGAPDLLRLIAVTLLPIVHDRIHVHGLVADGTPIGLYSDTYMKVRTGVYPSNGVYKSGPRKGETRSKGVYTKGAHKGEPRIQYNRSADRQVILSLTRQMENDFSVVEQNDIVGLGFKNELNYIKARFNENTYGKIIYGLTADEQQLSLVVAQDYVNHVIN